MSKLFRVSDQVIVIKGKSKGHIGHIRAIESRESKGLYAVVSGANEYKKAVKPNPEKGITSGFQTVERPISMANLAIYNATLGKKDRVLVQVVDGKKQRVYQSNQQPIQVSK